MKKKVLISLLSLCAISTASADEFPYLAFRIGDGNLRVMAIEDMNLTIADGNLVVTNSTEKETFALSDLSEMFFAADVSNVNLVESNTDSSIDVCSMAGVSFGKFATKSEAASSLSAGIYIARYSNGITEKFVVK